MNTVSGNYYLNKIFFQDLLFIASHAMACREMSRVTGAPESNASGLTIRLITPRGSSMAEAVVMVPRPRGTLDPAIEWREIEMATRLQFGDMGKMTVSVFQRL